MNAAHFTEKLLELAAACQIALSPQQANRCFQHIALMLQWNQRLNLTRITDLQQILRKHLLDSLLPARWLPHTGYVLDVGSGAGFPGVPLKILYPQLQLLLLEASRKKVSFLKVLASDLGLRELRAQQARWQELIQSPLPAAQPRYALVTMRAIRFEPGHLTQLAAATLAPGGLFAWWAGPSSKAVPLPTEGELQGSGMALVGDHHYTLPGAVGESRRIVLWQKRAR